MTAMKAPARTYAEGFAKAKSISEKPDDNFGEVAKVIVMAFGGLIAIAVVLVLAWNFIHWAAAPDLSLVDDRLGRIENSIEALKFPREAPPFKMSGTSTAIPVPVCEFPGSCK